MYQKIINELLNNENIGYSLINFLDDKEFEEHLKKHTCTSFQYILYNSFPRENDVRNILLMLTYIALKYYDGSFWPHVHSVFSNCIKDTKLLEVRIRDVILNRLVRKYHCERRHSQIPVMCSIIPINYAANYFDFVNDIYIKNLDCDLTQYNLNEEINNVFTSIKEKITDSDDDFNYTYGANSAKVYKLIKATKNIIKTGIKKEELILLTSDMLRKIDAYYNGKNIDFNYYINYSFEEWIKNNPILDDKISKKRKIFVKSKIPFYSYSKETGKIYFNSPSKRFFGDYDSNKFVVKIYENDKLLYNNETLSINHLLGGVEICQDKYEIKNPLNRIRFEILYNNEVVYDTKDTLFRDFMIFNENREITKDHKGFKGNAYFIYKNIIESSITFVRDMGSYRIGYAYVNENENYCIEDNYINFSLFLKSKIVGTFNNDIFLSFNKETINIYKDIDHILMVMPTSNINSYKIRINNEFKEVNDYIEIINQRNTSAYKINWEMFKNRSGLYKIELINIERWKIEIKYNFLYDNKLETQECLVSDYLMSLSYQGYYSLIDKNKKEYSYIETTITAPNDQRYYLYIEEEMYRLIINVNVPYYYIDEENKSSIYYPLNIERVGINSKMFYKVQNCNKVEYKIDNVVKELPIKTTEEKTFVDISQLLNVKGYKFLDLLFKVDDVTKYSLRIYYEAVYDEINSCYNIDQKNNSIEFKNVIYGLKLNEDVFLRLKCRGNVIYDDKINILNGINYVNVEEKIQKIKYEIYHNVKRLQGLKNVNREEVLYVGNIAFYPFKKLINRYIPITDVLVETKLGKKVTRFTENLYLKLIKELDDYSFVGYLYQLIGNKFEGFSKLDELKIAFSSVYKENEEYKLEADIYIYYPEDDEELPYIDYLQYDSQHKTILNSANDRDPYIKKYSLNLTKGEAQYEKFKSNKKSKIY